MQNNQFKPAQRHIQLTTADVIKMLRELKGWTQFKEYQFT
jgi:hypothetical protein